MKDSAGTIAVVTGGGSGMGRQLGDPNLSRGTESSRLGPSQMEVRRTPTRPDLLTSGDSNPRSRIGAKLARKQFLHGPIGWSIAESVQAAAAESAIVIGPKRARPTSCDASPFCQSGSNSGLYS
jgi:hypothetical protein